MIEEYLLRLQKASPWRDKAACRHIDTRIFFPVRGESTTPAKRICATCPVRAECDQEADTNGETYGVWGGRTRQPA